MKKIMGAGLLAAVGVAGLLAPLASPLPDGLERTTEKLGIVPGHAPFPIPFALPYTRWSGIFGTIAVFAAVIVLGRILRKKP